MKKFNSISFLALLIVLYVSRNAVPYAIYPLIGLLLPFTFYQIINMKLAKQALIKSVKAFSPVILLILIELAAIFLTVYPFQNRPFEMLKEITFISIFMFLLSYHIQSKQDFKQLIQHIGNYFIVFSIIISVVGLWKFLYSPAFISYNYLGENRHFMWGSSIVSDYNFFSLFLFNGLVFGLYKILNSPAKIKYKVLFLIGLQVIISTAFLSGSRRLVFCMGVFSLVCLLLLIRPMFKKVFLNEITYKYHLLFCGFSICTLGILYSFLSYFPLVSEKTEQMLLIDSVQVNLNISTISTRINSAASYPLIKMGTEVNADTINLAVLSDTASIASLGMSSVSSSDITPAIVPPPEIESLTSSRKELWILGKEIYREYSTFHKIFGHGFAFLDIFKKETEQPYPHHLFLSILLFSGIIGLMLYIAILLCCSVVYLFHFKDLSVLFLLFIVNFMCGFFSFFDFLGASFYALLIIFPLLYVYLYGYKDFLKELSCRIKKK